MAINFNGAYPEPSSKVGFSQNRLVRDAENRDETTLPTALAHKNVGFHLMSSNGAGGVILKDEIQSVFTQSESEQFSPNMVDAVLLGHGNENDDPRIAVSIDVEIGEDGKAANLPEGFELVGLRNLLYNSNIEAPDVGAIAQANSMVHWHNTNQYCGKCGTKSKSKIGGYRRDCPSCDHKIFPRTDPVVIMLAAKENKCLLGRSPHFPEGWYSTLAGYVEPGETIEDAVRRETFEESGIKIGRVQYYASQPWPFQSSLMIGAHCEALSNEINFDENELEDCQWFTRDEVLLMMKDKHPKGYKCPPNKAIASALIGAWAEG